MIRALILTSVVFLGACAVTPPPSIVKLPLTARSVAPVEQSFSNGSIFQASAGRQGLFEDRIARAVGDLLTITIEETLTATTKSSSNATRSDSVAAGAPTFNVPYLPGAIKNLATMGVSANGSNAFSGKGESNAANTFNGSISVTVIEVLPNGNLVVSGEKQVAINHQQQFLRLSGVVSPQDVRSGNTVSSTKLADARIEQRGNGIVNDAQDAGWLQKIFMTVAPF